MSHLSVIPAAALDDVAEKRMTTTQLRVLCGLGTCTNRHGWANDTNQQKIARKAGLVRETVNRALNKLEELGWVEVYESRNQYAQLAGLLCYRVVLNPPFGPDGERLESPTYKRRRAHIPSAQEREASDVGQLSDEAEADLQANASVLEVEPDDLHGSEGLGDAPCDRDVTRGGVIEPSQGGCDDCGHRGCDHCDHNRVDSSIDKSFIRTSARRMVRGERSPGIWFNPDIQLATALHDAKAKRDVTQQLNTLLGGADAATLSANMDVRAYIERGFVRWNMVFATHADAQALRDRLRGLGKGVVGASGGRVQICTEAHWARRTAEITMPYNPPDGELGQLFDQAIECGRSATDLAPCCEDGFVLAPDPDFKWAVRCTGMSSREVGRVFIGAIKALGWNPEIKPLPLVERADPETETAHG